MSASNGLSIAGHSLTPQASGPQHSSGPRGDSERSLIGIPAEDEHDRGLTFFFDSWTGQVSQTSASEGSESAAPENSPRAPPSDHSSGLPLVLTPQSDSDVLMKEVSEISLGESEASSASGANVIAAPSSSKSATLDSIISQETQSRSRLSEGRTPPMSPYSDQRSFVPVNPLQGIEDPRDTIVIDSEDIDFLIQSQKGQPDEPQHFIGPLLDPGIVTSHNSPKVRELPKSTRPEKKKSRSRSSHSPILVKGHRYDPKTQVGRKERRPLTEEGRQIARELRKIGACLRCLYNHEPCGLGDVCPRCKEMKSPRIWKMPCVRMRLVDTELHRTGFLSFPEGLPRIDTWVNSKVDISLYNVGNADPSSSPQSRPCLQISCCQHIPLPGVRRYKSWTKGVMRFDIYLPTYAMRDQQIRDAAKQMDVLVDAQYDTLVHELGIGQDEIVVRTLKEAIRQADNCEVLKNSLKISVMSRLASKSFNLFGANTLGIPQQQDPDCPYYKRIPIPPLLDAQIDKLWMCKMAELRKKVLTSLRAMIVKRGRQQWLKIFLTIQVLLFNLEFIYQNQDDQTKKYQERTESQKKMLGVWEYSAKILMAHFHTICHGTIPLEVDWNEEVQNAAEADKQSLDFVTQLKALVKSREKDLSEKAKGGAGQPLVWMSALFLPHEKS